MKTIQRKKRAKEDRRIGRKAEEAERETAKIPKSENTDLRFRKGPKGRVERIKRKSLILAQDERWRRA